MTEAKVNKIRFVSKEFSNGDTAEELLTSSRFLLYKSPNK
jgi:hypothetical protein